MTNGISMNVMIILSFYQKERITEQFRNDDAMKNKCWPQKNLLHLLHNQAPFRGGGVKPVAQIISPTFPSHHHKNPDAL